MKGNTMFEMKWEEPPQQLLGRGRTDWRAIADALKSNPNEWAVVAENVSASTGTHIRYGRLKAFEPSGAFEARVSGARADSSGRASKVYARFVGVGATTPTPAPVSEVVEQVEEEETPFSSWGSE